MVDWLSTTYSADKGSPLSTGTAILRTKVGELAGTSPSSLYLNRIWFRESYCTSTLKWNTIKSLGIEPFVKMSGFLWIILGAFCSVAKSCLTLWDPTDYSMLGFPVPHHLQSPLSFTVSWSLPKFMSFESKMPSNHLILCHSLLLLPIFPSIRAFSKE